MTRAKWLLVALAIGAVWAIRAVFGGRNPKE